MTGPPRMPADTPRNTMVIRRVRHPRHWREVEFGGERGNWASNGRPGPGPTIYVTPTGVRIVGLAGELNPSAARWVAARLAEAVGLYEAYFGGDGTVAPDDGETRGPVGKPPAGTSAPDAPVRAEKPAKSTAVDYLCGCGRLGSNRGAMTMHERSCVHGPVVPVERAL